MAILEYWSGADPEQRTTVDTAQIAAVEPVEDDTQKTRIHLTGGGSLVVRAPVFTVRTEWDTVVNRDRNR